MLRHIALLVLLYLALAGQSQDTLSYVNGSVSVIKTPWENNRRNLIFYDLKGEETYRIEEIHLSYQQTVKLQYFKNGAVKTAHVQLNSGGSPNHTASVIAFSSTNEPISMQTTTESLYDLPKVETFFWIPKTQTWQKQEQVFCNPLDADD